MNYLYLLLKFIIGGGIIVGVTMLAESVDPRYGGMLAAFPVITTLAFVFVFYEAGQETTRQLVLSAFWFLIPSFLFLATLYLLLGRFSLFPSLGGAYGIWIAAMLVMNSIVSAV